MNARMPRVSSEQTSVRVNTRPVGTQVHVDTHVARTRGNWLVPAERNHQGLGNKLIAPMNDNAANSGRVARRQRLGGELSYYYRKAA